MITTPVGGIPDVAIDNVNMLLFNPGDVDTLAEKLEKIIVDEALRDRIQKASSQLAMNAFSLATVTGQVAELYEQLSN